MSLTGLIRRKWTTRKDRNVPCKLANKAERKIEALSSVEIFLEQKNGGPRAQDPALGIEGPSMWNPFNLFGIPNSKKWSKTVIISAIYVTSIYVVWRLYTEYNLLPSFIVFIEVLNPKFNGLVCIRRFALGGCFEISPSQLLHLSLQYTYETASHSAILTMHRTVFLFPYMANSSLAPFMHRRPAFEPINPHIRVKIDRSLQY